MKLESSYAHRYDVRRMFLQAFQCFQNFERLGQHELALRSCASDFLMILAHLDISPLLSDILSGLGRLALSFFGVRTCTVDPHPSDTVVSFLESILAIATSFFHAPTGASVGERR